MKHSVLSSIQPWTLSMCPSSCLESMNSWVSRQIIAWWRLEIVQKSGAKVQIHPVTLFAWFLEPELEQNLHLRNLARALTHPSWTYLRNRQLQIWQKTQIRWVDSCREQAIAAASGYFDQFERQGNTQESCQGCQCVSAKTEVKSLEHFGAKIGTRLVETQVSFTRVRG